MKAYRVLYNAIGRKYDCQKTEVLALLADRPKLEAIKREVWADRFRSVYEQYKVSFAQPTASKAVVTKQEPTDEQLQNEQSTLECKIAPDVLNYMNGEMENPSSSDEEEEE